jgi:hypothetical protein
MRCPFSKALQGLKGVNGVATEPVNTNRSMASERAPSVAMSHLGVQLEVMVPVRDDDWRKMEVLSDVRALVGGRGTA